MYRQVNKVIFSFEVKGISIITAFMCAFLAILSISPFFLWYAKQLIVFLSLFVFLIFYFMRYLHFSRSYIQYVIAAVILFFSIIYFLLGNASLGYSFFQSLSIVFFYLMPYEDKLKTLFFFKKLFILSLIPGMILVILFLFGMDKNTLVLSTINSGVNPEKILHNTYDYIYPGAIFTNDVLRYVFVRLQGLYNEPGLVGTICGLFLFSKGFKFNRMERILIIIAGFMTISLAFYILFIIWFLSRISWRRLLIVFVSFGLLLGIFQVLPVLYKKQIDTLLLDRLKISHGHFAGDDRSSQLGGDWKRYLQADYEQLLFGGKQTADGSSWKSTFIQKGIVGFASIIIVYFLIVLFAEECQIRRNRLFFIVFWLSYLQRPDVLIFFYVLIFYAGLFDLELKPKLNFK